MAKFSCKHAVLTEVQRESQRVFQEPTLHRLQYLARNVLWDAVWGAVEFQCRDRIRDCFWHWHWDWTRQRLEAPYD